MFFIDDNEHISDFHWKFLSRTDLEPLDRAAILASLSKMLQSKRESSEIRLQDHWRNLSMAYADAQTAEDPLVARGELLEWEWDLEEEQKKVKAIEALIVRVEKELEVAMTHVSPAQLAGPLIPGPKKK